MHRPVDAHVNCFRTRVLKCLGYVKITVLQKAREKKRGQEAGWDGVNRENRGLEAHRRKMMILGLRMENEKKD